MPDTMSTPFIVTSKTAIVTGAGSGINFCFARLLLQRGCNVVIADLALRPEAQQLLDEYADKRKGRPRVVFVKTDVVRWDDLSNMFVVAEREFGGVDLVCPGAGVFEPPWSNFWHPPGSAASRDQVRGSEVEGIGHYALFDINLTHPIRTTQLAISHWLNPPAGRELVSTTNPKRVVHVASVASQLPSFSAPLYAASKHALAGFIRSLARLEDECGIRVNGVAPGVIKTPLWTDHPEKMRMLDEDHDEWIMPEEVAEAMLRCAESPDVGGGFVMEVLKGNWREVPALNNPGPQGSGASASNSRQTIQDALDVLREPGWGVLS